MPTQNEEVPRQGLLGEVVVAQVQDFERGKGAEASWQRIQFVHAARCVMRDVRSTVIHVTGDRR